MDDVPSTARKPALGSQLMRRGLCERHYHCIFTLSTVHPSTYTLAMRIQLRFLIWTVYLTPRLPDLPLRRPSSAGRQRPNSAGGMGGTLGQGAGAGAGGTHGNAHGVRNRIKPASAGVKSAWDEAPKSLPRAPPHGLTSSESACTKRQCAVRHTAYTQLLMAVLRYPLRCLYYGSHAHPSTGNQPCWPPSIA